MKVRQQYIFPLINTRTYTDNQLSWENCHPNLCSTYFVSCVLMSLFYIDDLQSIPVSDSPSVSGKTHFIVFFRLHQRIVCREFLLINSENKSLNKYFYSIPLTYSSHVIYSTAMTSLASQRELTSGTYANVKISRL